MAFASKSLTSGDLFGWREPVLPPGRTERLVDGVEHWVGREGARVVLASRPGAAARGAAGRGRATPSASCIADRPRRRRPARSRSSSAASTAASRAAPTASRRHGPRAVRHRSASAGRKAMRRVVPRDILERLTPGDLVVHIDHGIARYEQMLAARRATGEERDYLELVVRGRRPDLRPGRADRPRVALLGRRAPARSRASAARTGCARSSGSARRSTTSPRSCSRCTRSARPPQGFAFPPDTPWQARVGGGVPVRGDARPAARRRSRSRPTWRRAGRWTAWSSATSATARPRSRCAPRSRRSQDGKQVAVLVPTTVLAGSSTSRRSASGSRRSRSTVGLLSRFVSREGAGGDASTGSRPARSTSSSARTGCSARTSRSRTSAWSSSTRSSGSASRHKERLKQLRARGRRADAVGHADPADAEPGARRHPRHLSVIETPPEDRLPIQTRVAEASTGLVRDAILRELDRGGQVYFVHNRVETIEAQAEQLRRLLPERADRRRRTARWARASSRR